VLTDPDALADLSWDEDEEDFGLAEQWGYVPMEVLEDRGIDPDEHDAAFDEIDDFGEPTGEPFPEDDDAWFADRLPRLWATYGNRSIE
jgi:hypothetical protein